MKTHYYTQDIIDVCDCRHLTVDQIFDRISQKYPDAGKSSIYRNVEELVVAEKLRKVTGIGRKAYFEKNNGDHIHLIDTETGEIMDLDSSIDIPGLPEGFKAKKMDIRIFGEFSS